MWYLNLLFLCAAGSAPAASVADWTLLVTDAQRLSDQGRYGDAAGRYDEAISAAAKTGAPDRTARTLNNAAANLYYQGRYPEAEKLYVQAIRIFQDHPESAGDLLTARVNLAALMRAEARFDEAEHLYLQALQDAGNAQPATSLLNNLAELYRTTGHLEQAAAYSQRALKAAEAASPRDPVVLAKVLETSGSILLHRNKFHDAQSQYLQARDLIAQARGESHPDYAGVLANLAEVEIGRKRYAEAERLSSRALKIWEKALGPDHVNVATAANNLAQVYRFEQRYAEAEPLYRRALAIWEHNLGPSHPDYAKGMLNLADFFYERGRYAGAADLYSRSHSILKQTLGEKHPLVQETGRNLAKVYRAQGRPTDAGRVIRTLR